MKKKNNDLIIQVSQSESIIPPPRRVNFNNKPLQETGETYSIQRPCAACTCNETVRYIGHRATILDGRALKQRFYNTCDEPLPRCYTRFPSSSSLLLSFHRVDPDFFAEYFFPFSSFFKLHLSFPRPRFEYLFLIYPVYERPSFSSS